MIQKGGSLGDFFKTISRKVINPVYKEVVSPVYKTVLKPVVKEVKPFVNPVLKEAKGIGTAVGVDLAGALLEDAISGKSSKASAKARGQQAGLNAKNMATARVLQALAQNGNGFPKTDPLIALDNSIEENIVKPKPSVKRKRAQSTGLPPAKRKKSEPKKQPAKRKRTQKGGRKKRTQTGGFGGIFSALDNSIGRLARKVEKKARKRVLKRIAKKKRKSKKRKGKKRTQKGGRKKATLGGVIRGVSNELWP